MNVLSKLESAVTVKCLVRVVEEYCLHQGKTFGKLGVRQNHIRLPKAPRLISILTDSMAQVTPLAIAIPLEHLQWLEARMS